MHKLLVLLVAIGCSGDDGSTNPPTDSKTPDTPAGTACTGAVYDPCTVAGQCMSNMCKLFNQDNLQVCTQACTPGSACPMAGSTAVTCNNMGVCKPPAANNCTR